jgi:predicted alpha/beta superfamily hydrolase
MSPETIPDSPYSDQRSYDLQLPVCGKCTPTAPSNADNFIAFVDTAFRPWVQELASPNAACDRDALYGHSFGGLFVVCVLIARPDSFDTFLVASPALFRNDDYVHIDFLEPLKADVTPS